MRLAACLLALMVSGPALAGGIGLVATGGLHGEKVYFYDSSKEYRQYSIGETLPHFGGGLEVLLGDEDDRFTGVMRGYYLMDTPQRDPAEITQLVEPDDVVSDHRDTPRHLGVATVGLQWGFIGDPEGLMAVAVGSFGSGFLTSDHTEFMLLELGGGGSMALARDLRLFANVEYAMRYRKGVSHGVNAYAGLRWFFD
jgi:hypothetical protein